MALKSKKKKSKDLKIVPADKGNATVVMTNSQYQQKMEEHLNSGTYSLLKKNPTESLSRKLDAVVKKLLKEDKISKRFYDNSWVLHPRAPQIYGNPIRPIASFYDTLLSALHKQLSEVLKPLTLSDIRLKNSEDFSTSLERTQILSIHIIALLMWSRSPQHAACVKQLKQPWNDYTRILVSCLIILFLKLSNLF